MLRRRPLRVRRIPRWDLAPVFPAVPVGARERTATHPGWLAAAGLVVLAAWWIVRLPSGSPAEVARPRTVSDIQSVEISPVPPRPPAAQEVREPVPTNSVAAAQAMVPSSPSVGLVDAGAQGGSGNGMPGLDLGLEGTGTGMAVAAGGGGTGHGTGTGTGNGVGSQRMVYEIGQVDKDAATDRISDPPYPRRAKEDGVEAALELRILVDERGRVEKIEVLGAPPGYGFEAALESASRDWRFEPAQLGGVPVPEWVRMPYSFHLN
ncbi:MAG TPA: energy transducer TonB [Fibrobacteria bacterium]|nr:energy transducer TonB [Fibrobacteria bacterium]